VQLDPPFAQTNNSAITGRNRRKESKRISSHQLPIADVAVDAAAQNIRNRKSSATTETVMCCRIHNMNSGGCTVKLYKSGDEHDRRVTDSGRYRDRWWVAESNDGKMAKRNRRNKGRSCRAVAVTAASCK
jgi:hypothetical protein